MCGISSRRLSFAENAVNSVQKQKGSVYVN